MSERLFCSFPECDEPVFRDELCSTHTKQQQRGKALSPIQERLTPKQKLFEAVIAWADADSCDEEAYSEKERALLYAARVYGKGSTGEDTWTAAIERQRCVDAIRAGIAAARARGVRLGRPPVINAVDVVRMLNAGKSRRETAREMGVSKSRVEVLATKHGFVAIRGRRPRRTGESG